MWLSQAFVRPYVLSRGGQHSTRGFLYATPSVDAEDVERTSHEIRRERKGGYAR
jgi:hypothetical protein